MWMPVRVRDARARSLATIEDCKGAKAAKGGEGVGSSTKLTGQQSSCVFTSRENEELKQKGVCKISGQISYIYAIYIPCIGTAYTHTNDSLMTVASD